MIWVNRQAVSADVDRATSRTHAKGPRSMTIIWVNPLADVPNRACLIRPGGR